MTTYTNTALNGHGAGLTGAIAQLQARYAAWQLYRRTLGELRALDDRDLADLGISRYDIETIARESVYGA